MKKVLLAILGIFVAAIAIILGLAATKPATFRVERKAEIAAPAGIVFANLNDFHRWGAWSPWEHLDPKMTREFSGPDQGVGAAYAWRGDDNVGKGRMSIERSEPDRLVGIRLEFIEPMAATNYTTFELKPANAGTEVSWVMTGENTFFSKIMCVFVELDSMIGPDFERGLAQLKTVSQAQAVAARP